MLFYQLLLQTTDMRNNPQQAGYTLIEIIIVIILLGILIAGSGNLLKVGFNSFNAEKNIVNANWQGSVALERMTRDLRAVRSPADITTAAANSITINDIYGNTITYQVTGAQLLRNTQAIADGIQSITLAYYKGDTGSTLLTPLPLSAALLPSVRYVVITLNMNFNKIAFPITTAIYLWNLK